MIRKIVRDKSILGGRPFIAGTHISVSFILKQLTQGHTIKEIVRQYPQIRGDDIINAIKYAANLVDSQPFIEENEEN